MSSCAVSLSAFCDGPLHDVQFSSLSLGNDSFQTITSGKALNVTSAAVRDKTITETAVMDEPAKDAPVTDTCVTDVSVMDAAVADAVVTDASVSCGPVTDAAHTEAPITAASIPSPSVPRGCCRYAFIFKDQDSAPAGGAR